MNLKIIMLSVLPLFWVSCSKDSNDKTTQVDENAAKNSTTIELLGKNDLFKHKDWHSVDGLKNEILSLPVIEENLVKKVKVVSTVDEIKELIGFKPFVYYTNSSFNVIHVKSNEGNYYEAAFLLDDKKVIDVSYRELSVEQDLLDF